jgi:cytoplasmic tRNA 2-thiolation protein 1
MHVWTEPNHDQDEEDSNRKTLGTCQRCGYLSSNPICKACVLLEGLNKGKAKLAIGRQSKNLMAAVNPSHSSHSTSPWITTTTTTTTSSSSTVDRRTLVQTKNLDF